MKNVDLHDTLWAVWDSDGDPVAIVGAESIAQELADYWNEQQDIAHTDEAYTSGRTWIDVDVTKRFST